MALAKQLPVASGNVEVVLLDGGGFLTTEDTIIHADGHDRPYYLYDWCFYVYHKPTGRKILWDLGISDVSLCEIDDKLPPPASDRHHLGS